jgi:uncharacterized membrane protein YhfC
MPHTFPLSGAWTATTLITIVFIILYSFVLAAFVRQRFAVRWKYFGFGALIFFLFQIISRIPLTTAIQVVLTPQLKTSPILLYLWLGILAVTVGLFEEVGRYVGYRWLMRREEKAWNKAVMYGLGHGGLKSRACELLLSSFRKAKQGQCMLRTGGEMTPSGSDVRGAKAMDQSNGEIAEGGQNLWSVARA